MGTTIKGITIEIGGDTSPLNKALEGPVKNSRDLQSELRQVEKLLKFDPSNTELLAQKQKLLSESVDNTSQRLNILRNAEKQVQDQVKQGKISEEQYRAFQREIIKAETEMKGLKTAANETNDKIKDSQKAFKIFGEASEESAEKAKAAMAGVSTGLLALGAGLIKIAGDAAYLADDINTLSKTTGLATDTIQKMQYASENVDVSIDTISGSLVKLTKSMGEASKGNNDFSKAFKELHVNIRDGYGQLKDTEVVFFELLQALNKVGNETERDILTMKLFGRSAMELNPIIVDGGQGLKELGEQAEKAGLIMDQATLDKANKLADALDTLKATAKQAGLAVGAELADKISSILNSLVKNVAPILKMLLTLVGVIASIPTPVLALIGILLTTIATMSAVGKAVDGVTGFLGAFDMKSLKTTMIVFGVVAALVALAAIIAVIVGRGNDLDRAMESIGRGINGVQGNNIPRYASGTSNHPGGPALINEYGGEIVSLPAGAAVIPHDISMAIAQSGGNQNITVTVNANDLQQVSDVVDLFDRFNQFKRVR